MNVEYDDTARRLENAEWMLDNGEWPERAAARLGMSMGGMARMMWRHSQRDDLKHFVSQIDQNLKRGGVAGR